VATAFVRAIDFPPNARVGNLVPPSQNDFATLPRAVRGRRLRVESGLSPRVERFQAARAAVVRCAQNRRRPSSWPEMIHGTHGQDWFLSSDIPARWPRRVTCYRLGSSACATA
jgi:hypothetical protein